MLLNRPIKCAAAGYNRKPFYVIDRQKQETRYVVSFQDGVNIKQFLLHFMDESIGRLEVRIIDHGDYQNPITYTGFAANEQIQTLIEKYEDLVLYDGGHELWISRPENESFVVFDDHGLVYVYTKDDYTNILNGYGLTPLKLENPIYTFMLDRIGLTRRKRVLLIHEINHWHVRSPNAADELKRFIEELGLSRS